MFARHLQCFMTLTHILKAMRIQIIRDFRFSCWPKKTEIWSHAEGCTIVVIECHDSNLQSMALSVGFYPRPNTFDISDPVLNLSSTNIPCYMKSESKSSLILPPRIGVLDEAHIRLLTQGIVHFFIVNLAQFTLHHFAVCLWWHRRSRLI